MDFSLIDYFIFALVGFFGAFVDAIAGGGGLICIPALFAMGLPPHLALGTNKLQGFFGTAMATFNYHKKGLMKFSDFYIGILFTLIGAVCGTITLLHTNVGFLKILTPIILSIIFIYTLFSPSLGDIQRKPLINKNLFYITFGLIIGFYDGFFGAGTGSIWTFAIIFLIGLDIKSSVAQTKALNLTSNVIALIIFIINNQIDYKVGLIMGISQLIGGYIGSNFVIKGNVKFIKKIFLAVVALTIAKIFYDFLIKGTI